jgi:hypothetical protein
MCAVLLWVTPVSAQNVCDPNPPAKDIGIYDSIPAMAMISPQHAAVNLAGQRIIDHYFVEIFEEGSTVAVTSFTLPTTSWTLQTDTPADCYLSPAMPAVGGLLPTSFYRAQVTARGQGGQTSSTPLSTDRFFLLGAPVVSGLRLVAPQ